MAEKVAAMALAARVMVEAGGQVLGAAVVKARAMAVAVAWSTRHRWLANAGCTHGHSKSLASDLSPSATSARSSRVDFHWAPLQPS